MFILNVNYMLNVYTQCELYTMFILNVNYMLNVYTQCELYAQCLDST